MENQVLDILESICGVDEVRTDLDMNLFDAGLLDSLGVIELLLAIEEQMQIKIEPTEIERTDIETANKIIAYLSKRG